MIDPVPVPVRSEHRVTAITVRGKRLRVAVRPATRPGPARTPLLLMNGLGSQLEVLEPLVDQLPSDLEVIRFDVPGVGGSPAPVAVDASTSRLHVPAWVTANCCASPPPQENPSTSTRSWPRRRTSAPTSEASIA